jgi:hypothetical protein
VGVYDDGPKCTCSHAKKAGYNVTLDSQGRNMLTGRKDDGDSLDLYILEIFEVECLNPPN